MSVERDSEESRFSHPVTGLEIGLHSASTLLVDTPAIGRGRGGDADARGISESMLVPEALAGEGLGRHADDTLAQILAEAERRAQMLLQDFARREEFDADIEMAFGEGADATALRSAWLRGDFAELPAVEVRPAADINGANGAYEREQSQEWLGAVSSIPTAIMPLSPSSRFVTRRISNHIML